MYLEQFATISPHSNLSLSRTLSWFHLCSSNSHSLTFYLGFLPVTSTLSFFLLQLCHCLSHYLFFLSHCYTLSIRPHNTLFHCYCLPTHSLTHSFFTLILSFTFTLIFFLSFFYFCICCFLKLMRILFFVVGGIKLTQSIRKCTPVAQVSICARACSLREFFHFSVFSIRSCQDYRLV